MRIALFDWAGAGHHPVYLRRVAEALADHDLSIAAPVEVIDGLELERVDLHRLEPAPASSQLRARRDDPWLVRECSLLREVAEKTRADHVLHLYGDRVLPRLVAEPPLPAPTTICLFHTALHYPLAYRSSLTARELARAARTALFVRRWRRRPDAHALFGLDPEAVRRWSEGGGAPAYWFPEPPVTAPAPPAARREGCIVYGVLSPRKGIDRVAAAVEAVGGRVGLVLAGPIEDGYEAELARLVARMRTSGATVEVDDRVYDEEEGLRALASASCALLVYDRHVGMSRVLLEASVARTPVIVSDYGLLAHLVRTHGLGLAVDPRDARALGDAMLRLADPSERERFEPALARFCERYSPEAFRAAVRAPFG